MLIAGPQIARLAQRPARWALRRISDGTFGPVIRRRGRIREVDLRNVERVMGEQFSRERLAAAGLHLPAEFEPETEE